MTRVTCRQRQSHSNLTSAVAVPAAHPFPSVLSLRLEVVKALQRHEIPAASGIHDAYRWAGFVFHPSNPSLVEVGGGYGF